MIDAPKSSTGPGCRWVSQSTVRLPKRATTPSSAAVLGVFISSSAGYMMLGAEWIQNLFPYVGAAEVAGARSRCQRAAARSTSFGGRYGSGVPTIEVQQARPFAGEPVNAGRWRAPEEAAVTTQFAITEVVGEHKNDVGALCGTWARSIHFCLAGISVVTGTNDDHCPEIQRISKRRDSSRRTRLRPSGRTIRLPEMLTVPESNAGGKFQPSVGFPKSEGARASEFVGVRYRSVTGYGTLDDRD